MMIFRAWINDRGFNEDRDHDQWCMAPLRCQGDWERYCRHIRLRDIERDDFRIAVRVLTRRRPFYFHVLLSPDGARFITILRLGREAA